MLPATRMSNRQPVANKACPMELTGTVSTQKEHIKLLHMRPRREARDTASRAKLNNPFSGIASPSGKTARIALA